MTIFYFVRHGRNDWLGRGIAGRTEGVELNEQGLADAKLVADLLKRRPIAAVYSSPLERARQTAEPIAVAHGLDVGIADELNELDFGNWNGKTLEELDRHEGWQPFNTFRIGHRPPNGELMVEVQHRMAAFVLQTWKTHPDQEVVLVGHGDPIRCALMYFLGMPLDFYDRLEISPGSISAIGLEPWGAKLLFSNLTHGSWTALDPG